MSRILDKPTEYTTVRQRLWLMRAMRRANQEMTAYGFARARPMPVDLDPNGYPVYPDDVGQ